MNNEKLINTINSLCKSHNISINKMLQECNLNKSIVDNLKKGSDISAFKLLKIAEYFDCSLDYLLGQSKTLYIDDSDELSCARKRVKNIYEHGDYQIKDLEEAFSTNYATFRSWCDGQVDFFNNKISLLANYFGCSVDYLLGRTDVPEVNKKTAYVHHMDEQYSVPYIAAYGEGDVTAKGKFTDEDIEEIERRGRNH